MYSDAQILCGLLLVTPPSVLWRYGDTHLDDQRQGTREQFCAEPPLSSLR
jgi:hypothetical protein